MLSLKALHMEHLIPNAYVPYELYGKYWPSSNKIPGAHQLPTWVVRRSNLTVQSMVSNICQFDNIVSGFGVPGTILSL